ncbi:MAG: VOC family protein [Deltaproteobacteria bacterium]|jgi:catechol 2,3-dioxygenase-like lactoylglutathione lyase family enzyme
MSIEINGVAHVMLTVANIEECRPFYAEILTFMGLKPVIDSDSYLYCVGGRTAVGIQPASDEYKGQPFAQTRSGLHHVCFRARSREDVDEFYQLLLRLEATIVHAPEEGPWAPGYYSVLFEDPDGIRLEMNHVPGKGLLDK